MTYGAVQLDRPTRTTRCSLQRVAVLGGGMTGLTAAWYLQRGGRSPVVFEQSHRVGGAVASRRDDEWLHEAGPNSLLENSPDLTRFIEELGLGLRRVDAALAAKQRYIVRDARLVAMPASLPTFLATRLFSWRAKLHLLGEPWRKPAPPLAEESVTAFVVRRLGREFLDYAVDPFVGGVYAGNPGRLSTRQAFPKLHSLEQEHGSLIRGAIAKRNASGGPSGKMFSFPEGLGEIPAAVVRQLNDAVRTRHTVTAVRRIERGWSVEFEHLGAKYSEEFAAVVSALPAHGLASLALENVEGAEDLLQLGEIEQPSVVSVMTGYRRADIPHALDGFGFLVPQVENRLILGSLFSSTLFPRRAPENCVALTTFLGGMRAPELTDMSDQEIVRLVHGELRELVGAKAAPIYTHVRRCPRAIPQYTIGYQRFKDVMASIERAAPGFFIGGNARDGISLPNCIASGKRLADAAKNHIQATVPVG